MRGRKTPTPMKILAGNPSHLSKAQLDPEREPQYRPAERGTLKPPSFLDAAGKLEWRRVAKELSRIGLFQVVDRTALACYCVAYSDLKAAREIINKCGHTYEVHNQKTGTTFINQRPELVIASSAMDQVRRFCGEFGFTPSSRGRIEMPSVKGPSPLQEALSRPRTIRRRDDKH